MSKPKIDELPELEASRVKEAALDDKLGIELKSIVEQIQVTQMLKVSVTSIQHCIKIGSSSPFK